MELQEFYDLMKRRFEEEYPSLDLPDNPEATNERGDPYPIPILIVAVYESMEEQLHDL